MKSDPKHIFDEYIVQGETSRKQRAEHWQIAIGLQDVDKLKTSPYLLDTAKQHIEGKLDLATAQKRITDYYLTEEGRKVGADRTDEADIVATRILEILEEDAFAFIPDEYSKLHERMFHDIFPHAGQYRTKNISKNEWVLDGESVVEFKEQTRWSLLNAFTEIVKKYSPQRVDHSYLALNRAFGLDGRQAAIFA